MTWHKPGSAPSCGLGRRREAMALLQVCPLDPHPPPGPDARWPPESPLLVVPGCKAGDGRSGGCDPVTVLLGDCRDILPTLDAGSVHCVVSSPPYWGLRDYGTASWDGGDPECDHVATGTVRTPWANSVPGPAGGTAKNAPARNETKEVGGYCGKCGARRIDRQLGLEPTPEEYVANMVAVFREVRRVLRDDGTVWLNLGDTFAANGGTVRPAPTNTGNGAAGNGVRRSNGPIGLKPKDLVGIPWRVAFALQADGWYLRSAVTWCKKAPMPESVTDRPTSATEMVFLLTKAARYYYDSEAVRPETGANLRNYWVLGPQPFPMKPVVRSEAVGADAVGGDIRRTTSRDCPLHGGWLVPAATAPDDGYAAASGDVLRSPGTSGHPALAPSPELVPTGPLRAADSEAGSSDWPPLSYAPVATSHSNGSHRTDLAPATTLPYTPSDGTSARTVDTSASPASVEPRARKPESSSEPDGTAAHSPDRSASRSSRTSSCTCSYRRVTTESISHFATFPEALVVPCIKAGTSERGVCSECGAPWERVVEREPESGHERPLGSKLAVAGDDVRGSASARMGRGAGWRKEPQVATATTGWRPTCAHDAPTVPALILDPFSGSGTVGRVAERLSRRSILIELNPAYVALAEERTAQVGLGLSA